MIDIKLSDAYTNRGTNGLIDHVSYGDSFGFNLFYTGLKNNLSAIAKGSRKDFIFGLYRLWKLSSYNPYQHGILSEDNFNKFRYNRELGSNPDPDDNFWNDTLGLSANYFNFNAAPVILNYISKEFAGLYLDNFKFYLAGLNDDLRFFGENFRNYKNQSDVPYGKILAVKDDYTKSGEKGLYGTYDIYQPVSLIDSNQQASMKIPVIGGGGRSG